VTKTSTTNSVVNPPIGKDNNEGDKVNEAGDDDGARNQHNKDNEAGEDEEGVHNQNNDSDNETSGSDGTDIDADIRRITGTTCVDGFRFVPSFDPSAESSRPLTIPFKNIGSFSKSHVFCFVSLL